MPTCFTLGQGLEMLDFGAGSSGVVVVPNARGLGSSHYKRVIRMKQNEIGSGFQGLSECEAKGALIRWNFRGKQNGLCSARA